MTTSIERAGLMMRARLQGVLAGAGGAKANPAATTAQTKQTPSSPAPAPTTGTPQATPAQQAPQTATASTSGAGGRAVNPAATTGPAATTQQSQQPANASSTTELKRSALDQIFMQTAQHLAQHQTTQNAA